MKIGEERKRKLTSEADNEGGPADFLASIEVLIVEQVEKTYLYLFNNTIFIDFLIVYL